jgi:hypothetical protein
VTDLPPVVAVTAWYSMRAWIKISFKDIERGGWHWEQTKMADPARATRLWLAIALQHTLARDCSTVLRGAFW